jgi:predicted MFS family arabinose efflux permease
MAFISAKSAVLLVLLIYMMWEFSDLIIQQYMHEHIKSSHRATVISIQRMVYGILVVITYLLLGKLTDIYSMKTTFILSACLVLALGSGLLYIRYKRKVWRKLD